VHFADPYWLFLLALVPALGWWSVRRRPAAITHPRLAAVVARGLRPGRAVRLRHVPLGLRLLALALLVIALARPQVALPGRPATSLGVDIMVALDISGSMGAQDFRPNRLEVAKRVVGEFAEGRPADRVGLVLFAAYAFTRVPLTLDHALLARQLDRVELGLIDDGTAIGDALATALGRLADSPAASRVVVLLTDGVNNRGEIDPLTAADMAARAGVRVYTVGVGSGEPFYQVEDDPVFGRRRVRMEAKVDEALLTKVANLTGGRFFRARDADALRAIYRRIDALEKSPLSAHAPLLFADRYPWPAAAGLLLLLLEWALAAGRLRRVPG
jgi:Ca-activated chloride channel family protein